MNLDDLFQGVEIAHRDSASLPVSSIAIRVDQISADSVFIKCRYPGLDGTAAEAARRGACHVVLEAGDLEVASLPQTIARTVVRNVNRAYATVCANFVGNVHRRLTIIGVTGTKGKTTTCHLVDAALRHAGLRTGLISSLVLRLPSGEHHARNTTPEPMLLHRFLREVVRQGGTHVVLEVSSIGIAEERIHGLSFAALAFTNLGTDHFEYHGGRDGYIETKRRLFQDTAFHASKSTPCVFDTDDPIGRDFAASTSGRAITLGLHVGDVTPEAYSYDLSGLSMRIDGREMHLPLIGEHNVYNALAAIALTREFLGSTAAAAMAIQQANPPEGRLERVPTRLGVDVYVDYAHTPESVRAVLRTVAIVGRSRRRIAVIGCSGNSDRGKRPLIARAALEGSDLCILTSDNPNYEHPAAILREMITSMGAIDGGEDRVRTIVDRAAAIATAIELALPDGIVVLMGKGTETSQLVEGQRLPHNDYQVATQVLKSIEERVSGR